VDQRLDLQQKRRTGEHSSNALLLITFFLLCSEEDADVNANTIKDTTVGMICMIYAFVWCGVV
jgi:hypothetical protein